MGTWVRFLSQVPGQRHGLEQDLVEMVWFGRLTLSVRITLCLADWLGLCASLCVWQTGFVCAHHSVFGRLAWSLRLTLCFEDWLALCASIFVSKSGLVCAHHSVFGRLVWSVHITLCFTEWLGLYASLCVF